MNAAIAGLFVYPVKSCRGISVLATTVSERGLQRDREWMIVDLGGRFLTQREVPRLALITPSIGGTALHLNAPAMPTLDVAFDFEGKPASVTVFRDTLIARDGGDSAAQWLSAFLNRPVRLVRFDASSRRYCNKAYAGETGAHIAFSDGYPVLVLSDASLADLNTRLATPLPMNRFRPNIVLSGVEAYEEDHIDAIVSGNMTLNLVKPCVRCQITTTDQATGLVGIEPLSTLGGYRRSDVLEGVTFGMNAIVTTGAGAALVVGDTVFYTLRF